MSEKKWLKSLSMRRRPRAPQLSSLQATDWMSGTSCMVWCFPVVMMLLSRLLSISDTSSYATENMSRNNKMRKVDVSHTHNKTPIGPWTLPRAWCLPFSSREGTYLFHVTVNSKITLRSVHSSKKWTEWRWICSWKVLFMTPLMGWWTCVIGQRLLI
jgi:hypothetical protein